MKMVGDGALDVPRNAVVLYTYYFDDLFYGNLVLPKFAFV
jgi:hypothetical protein